MTIFEKERLTSQIEVAEVFETKKTNGYNKAYEVQCEDYTAIVGLDFDEEPQAWEIGNSEHICDEVSINIINSGIISLEDANGCSVNYEGNRDELLQLLINKIEDYV